MSEMDRRQFGWLALAAGIALVARALRRGEGDLSPTPADPAVAEGRRVWITLPSGKTLCRVCRKGYWVTEDPPA
jgi:hypothetical protein